MSSSVAAGQPPPKMGSPTTSTEVHNFAIHHLYAGDDDPTPSYTPDMNAWKRFGYNLDGLVTTQSSTDVCTPYMAGRGQQVDGDNGIDNAFGSTVVPIFTSFGNLSESLSSSIVSGTFTCEIDTTGLAASQPGQTATGLGGQLFPAGSYGQTPPTSGSSFALTDSWPVDRAFLNAGTIASGSKLAFPGAYVTGGTWVSGTPIDLSLAFGLAGGSLTLTIHHAILSFDYAVSGGQGHATSGVIAGVLDTQEFVAALNQAFGALGSPPGEYCSLVASVIAPVKQAQDIVLDTTTEAVSNPRGTPCNAISIGLGFDADEIATPTQIAATPDAGTPAPPCGADAG